MPLPGRMCWFSSSGFGYGQSRCYGAAVFLCSKALGVGKNTRIAPYEFNSIDVIFSRDLCPGPANNHCMHTCPAFPALSLVKWNYHPSHVCVFGHTGTTHLPRPAGCTFDGIVMIYTPRVVVYYVS